MPEGLTDYDRDCIKAAQCMTDNELLDIYSRTTKELKFLTDEMVLRGGLLPSAQ